jgi:DUF1680 family protein
MSAAGGAKPAGAAGPLRADRIRRLAPDAVHMEGLLGERHRLSRVNRLRHQEDEYFLWAFKEHCQLGFRPFDSPHPQWSMGDWPGEFLGTYLDSAILSAWNAGDAELRQKVDGIVERWLALQEPDGYLGTYAPEDRWQRWDVWVHRHDLIGLLRYWQYTGDARARAAAVRIGDLIVREFGPGRRPLHDALHMGMASSAIVAQMVWLHWETGDQRYLDWARWAVEHWEEPGGPAIMSSLMAGRGVAGTATRKAAELQICLLGLLELCRATGEDRYLAPVLVAWDDLVANEVYVTGGSTNGEYFTPDHVLRDDYQFRVAETCVTVSWLQVNLELAALTGEARFYDQAEQTIHNHLLAAQSPDGRGWNYFTGLRDAKRYRWHYDPDCCPQRGSRAVALLPLFAYGVTDDAVAANLYAPGRVTCTVGEGAAAIPVRLDVETEYPADGGIAITVHPDAAGGEASFGLRLRKPGWCAAYRVAVNGDAVAVEADPSGYLDLRRTWRAGDRVELTLDMPMRVVTDTRNHPNRVAVVRGPLVFAADTSLLPAGMNLDALVLALDPSDPAHDLRVTPAPDGVAGPVVDVPILSQQPATAQPVWHARSLYRDVTGPAGSEAVARVPLVPFYDAGNRAERTYADKGRFSPHTTVVQDISYQTWLPYVWRRPAAAGS